MFLIVQSKVEAAAAFQQPTLLRPNPISGSANVRPVACPRLATLIVIDLCSVADTRTQEQLLKPQKIGIENSNLIQAGSLLFCHLSSTGFSNAPQRNSVLSVFMCCIRAAASEVCETVQRKRRFGGQATFLWSVSPCCLIAYLVDKRRFIQCNIRGARVIAPDKNVA